MELKPRQVQLGNGWGRVKRRQNIAELLSMFRVYAAWVILFKQPFKPLVENCPYDPAP